MCLSFLHLINLITGLVVPELTVDAANDVTCSSILFMKRHQTLPKAIIAPLSPSCMSLIAAKCLPLEVKDLVMLSITLGDIIFHTITWGKLHKDV